MSIFYLIIGIIKIFLLPVFLLTSLLEVITVWGSNGRFDYTYSNKSTFGRFNDWYTGE